MKTAASIGLLLAEMDRLADAEPHLRTAAVQLPGRPRVLYNHALVLQRLDRPDAALAQLRLALQRAPDHPELLNAVVQLCVKQRRWTDALPYARRLAALFPHDRSVRAMLRQIETAAR